MKVIEIFGQSGCLYCARAYHRAKAFQFAVTYRDIAISGNREEMFARYPEAKTVPQIFIGDAHVGGHDAFVAIPVSQLQQMVKNQ